MEYNNMLNIIHLHNNVNDEVQIFCKKNNIEYSWDWNTENGSWNEILFNGKLLMQITQGIKLEQFLNVINILSNDYYSKEFDDDGIEFDICLINNKEHEILFNDFIKHHSHLFKNKLDY